MLKVGDYVEIIDDSLFGPFYHKGMVGQITEADWKWFTINFNGIGAQIIAKVYAEEYIKKVDQPIHVPEKFKNLFNNDKCCILPDVAGVLIAKIQSMLDNQNKLIINKPAVILYRNGKKYVVKTTKGDKWDEEKGVALALLKSFGVDYKTLKKIIEQAKRGDKKGK